MTCEHIYDSVNNEKDGMGFKCIYCEIVIDSEKFEKEMIKKVKRNNRN